MTEINPHFKEYARTALESAAHSMRWFAQFELEQVKKSPHDEDRVLIELRKAAVERVETGVSAMRNFLDIASTLEDMNKFFRLISNNNITHRNTVKQFNDLFTAPFSITLPAGKYWLGDPGYVIDHEQDTPLASWYTDAIESDRLIILSVEGQPFVGMGTPHGDGSVTLSGNGIDREFYIDSGTFAVVPLSLVQKSLKDHPSEDLLGMEYTFDEPFTVEFLRTHNQINDVMAGVHNGAHSIDDLAALEEKDMARFAGFSLVQ